MTSLENASAPLFDETLRTPVLFQAFLQYMEEHVAAENFLFINAVILLHNAACASNSDDFNPAFGVRRVISQFVCDGAPAEINISASNRAAVTKAFLIPDKGVGYSYDEYSSSSSDDEFDSSSNDGKLSLEQLQPVMDEMRLLTMPHYRAWIATGAWKDLMSSGLCALRASEAPSARQALTTPILCSMFGTYLREHIDYDEADDVYSEKEKLLMKVEFLEEAAPYCNAHPLGQNGLGSPDLRKNLDDDGKKDRRETSEKKMLEQKAKEICKKYKHALGRSQKGVSYRISIFTHVEATVSFVSSCAAFQKWLETREWGAAGFTTSEKLHQTREILSRSNSPLVVPTLASALCRGVKYQSVDEAATADFLFLPTSGMITNRNPALRMQYSWGDCVYDILSLSNAQKEFCFLVDVIAFHKRFAAVATTASSNKNLVARMNDMAREIYKRYFAEQGRGLAATIHDAVSSGLTSTPFPVASRGASPQSVPGSPAFSPQMASFSLSGSPSIPPLELGGFLSFNLMNIDKAIVQEIRGVFDGILFKGKATPDMFTKAAQQVYFNAKNTWYKDIAQIPLWTQHEYDNSCSEAVEIEKYLDSPFIAEQCKYTEVRPDDVMDNPALRKNFFSSLPLEEVNYLTMLVRVIDEMERKDSLTPNDITKVSKVVEHLHDDYPLISAQMNTIQTNMRGMRRVSNLCLSYIKETAMRFLFFRYFNKWKESFDPASVSWTPCTGFIRFSGLSFLSHMENMLNLYPDSLSRLAELHQTEMKIQTMISDPYSDDESDMRKKGDKSKGKEKKVKTSREKGKTLPKELMAMAKKKKKDEKRSPELRREHSEEDLRNVPSIESLGVEEKSSEKKKKKEKKEESEKDDSSLTIPSSPEVGQITPRPRSISSVTSAKDVHHHRPPDVLCSPKRKSLAAPASGLSSPRGDGEKKASESKANDYFVDSDSDSDVESSTTTGSSSGYNSKKGTLPKKGFAYVKVNGRSNSFVYKSSSSSGAPSCPDSPVVLSGHKVLSKRLPAPDFEDILQSRYLRSLFTDYVKSSPMPEDKQMLWFAFAGFYNDYCGLDSLESLPQQKSMAKEATEIIEKFGDKWPEKAILLKHISSGCPMTSTFFKKVERRLFSDEHERFVLSYSSVWTIV